MFILCACVCVHVHTLARARTREVCACVRVCVEGGREVAWRRWRRKKEESNECKR